MLSDKSSYNNETEGNSVLLVRMYPPGFCERWAGFFWQLPLLMYIIWLNFVPVTSLAPCYTTCSVRENPPSHTHIMQPPCSLYFFLIFPSQSASLAPDLRARHSSLHHVHLCFLFSLPLAPSPYPSPFTASPNPLLPPGM